MYKKAFDNSKAYHGTLMVVFVSPAFARMVGFTASRKVGGSVERNHARRLMKEIPEPSHLVLNMARSLADRAEGGMAVVLPYNETWAQSADARLADDHAARRKIRSFDIFHQLNH